MLSIEKVYSSDKQPQQVCNHCAGLSGLMASSYVEAPYKGTHIIAVIAPLPV